MSKEKRPIYQVIASVISAYKNCIEVGNTKWRDNWIEILDDIVRNYLPSGNGFDNGTQIDIDKSTSEKIVLSTSYHHMNESGMYCGWSNWAIVVTGSLLCEFDIDLNITDTLEYIEKMESMGVYFDLDDYFYDVFHTTLSELVAY